MKKHTKKNRTSLPDNQPKPAPMAKSSVEERAFVYETDDPPGCRTVIHPVAVIPCATAKQAKALADFCNLSEEEQWERICQITEDGGISPAEQADAIHAMILGGAK